LAHRDKQIVTIKVSNACEFQCIYHEINSQLIFLNFKAGFGDERFTSYSSYFLCAWFVHVAHRIFVATQKQYWWHANTETMHQQLL